MLIDNCFTSLKALLSYTEANLTTNLPAARNFHRLISTANEILSGHYAKLEPFYDPLTPRFMSAVVAVNTAIVNGQSSPADFNEYVALLITELNS